MTAFGLRFAGAFFLVSMRQACTAGGESNGFSGASRGEGEVQHIRASGVAFCFSAPAQASVPPKNKNKMQGEGAIYKYLTPDGVISGMIKNGRDGALRRQRPCSAGATAEGASHRWNESSSRERALFHVRSGR